MSICIFISVEHLHIHILLRQNENICIFMINTTSVHSYVMQWFSFCQIWMYWCFHSYSVRYECKCAHSVRSEWVMAHVWMSHGTRMHESWHTYEWVMAHVWMSHGTHVNEHVYIHQIWMYWCSHSVRYECKCSHSVRYECAGVVFVHSYLKQHQYIHISNHHLYIHIYSQIKMNNCTFTLAMTHSNVCHDSFIRVPWLMHTCAMTHSYVCHDSFILMPWLIHDSSQIKINNCTFISPREWRWADAHVHSPTSAKHTCISAKEPTSPQKSHLRVDTNAQMVFRYEWAHIYIYIYICICMYIHAHVHIYKCV